MSTLTTVISYALIFPALIILRKSHGHVHRPYRVPGGIKGAWIITGLTTAWSLFATAANMWPYDPVADYGVSRTEFELWVVGVLGTIFLLGCVFYFAGTKHRNQMVDVPLEGHEAESEASSPLTDGSKPDGAAGPGGPVRRPVVRWLSFRDNQVGPRSP